MARNEIKIGADVSSIKKSINDISRTIDSGLGRKTSIKLFDDKTLSFIKSGAKDAIKALTGQMDDLKKQSEKYTKELNKSNLSEKASIKLKKELLATTSKIYQTEKEINGLQQSTQNIVSGRRGRFSKIGGIVNKIPGMGGGLFGGISNMLMGLGPMGLLAGGALAAGGFGLSRTMSGYNAFKPTVNARLALRGRGLINPTGRNNYLQNRLGLNPSEVQQSQMQSINTFGINNSEMNNTNFKSRMKFLRAFGVNSSQYSSAFAGATQNMGFNRINRTEEEFRATIISKKLEGALDPYLDTLTKILSDINQDGVTLTTPAINAIASIAGKGNKISPQAVAATMGGLDKNIRNATGENLAFYMQAFQRQGLGKGSLGGLSLIARTGLFGINNKAMTDRLSSMYKPKEVNQISGLFKNLGLSGGPELVQKRAKGIMDELRFRMGNKKAIPKNAFDLMQLSGLLQIKNPEKAIEAKGVLEKLEKGGLSKQGQEKYKKELSELQMGADERVNKKLDKIMSGPGGTLKIYDAESAAAKEILGEKVAPGIAKMGSILIHIDKLISSIPGMGKSFEENQIKDLSKKPLNEIFTEPDINLRNSALKEKATNMGTELPLSKTEAMGLSGQSSVKADNYKKELAYQKETLQNKLSSLHGEKHAEQYPIIIKAIQKIDELTSAINGNINPSTNHLDTLDKIFKAIQFQNDKLSNKANSKPHSKLNKLYSE